MMSTNKNLELTPEEVEPPKAKTIYVIWREVVDSITAVWQHQCAGGESNV